MNTPIVTAKKSVGCLACAGCAGCVICGGGTLVLGTAGAAGVNFVY